MDLAGLAPWLVLAFAVAVALIAYRVVRARARRDAIRRAEALATSDEEAFLDSSHISGPIGSARDRGPAAPLRPGEPPRK